MSTNNERYELNKNLAQMLKGGVIMDVTTPEQAKIAESDILQKLRYFRQLKSTILMKAKSFHLQMMSTILTKESLMFHLSAVQKILAKHSDVSMKELL